MFGACTQLKVTLGFLPSAILRLLIFPAIPLPLHFFSPPPYAIFLTTSLPSHQTHIPLPFYLLVSINSSHSTIRALQDKPLPSALSPASIGILPLLP